jgi:hypothetical protein
MDYDNTNENKKTKGGINPLLEKLLAGTLGLAFVTCWMLIIALATRFLMLLFGL